MNILVAPNSMKGSLSAFDFADIVEQALKYSGLDCAIRKVPVADGGDYTGQILSRLEKAKTINKKVIGPLGKLINASYWVSGNKAIIEMAEASGMKLVDPVDLNPLKATSFGTGQLIVDALQYNCNEIWLAIGGSATVDGGMGMLEGIGFRFFDDHGNVLKGNGQNLAKVGRIEKVDLPENLSVKIISDVNNPLLGENGAAAFFGPQKGATPAMVDELEMGLKRWQEILISETGRKFASNGLGAAGGIALPLLAYFNATMEAGASFVLKILDFEQHLRWADIVITGEGKLDNQTNNLKAPFVVAQLAKEFEKPVYAFVGIEEEFRSTIYNRIFSLVNDSVTKEEALKYTRELLYGKVIEFATFLQNQ